MIKLMFTERIIKVLCLYSIFEWNTDKMYFKKNKIILYIVYSIKERLSIAEQRIFHDGVVVEGRLSRECLDPWAVLFFSVN